LSEILSNPTKSIWDDVSRLRKEYYQDKFKNTILTKLKKTIFAEEEQKRMINQLYQDVDDTIINHCIHVLKNQLLSTMRQGLKNIVDSKQVSMSTISHYRETAREIILAAQDIILDDELLDIPVKKTVFSTNELALMLENFENFYNWQRVDAFVNIVWYHTEKMYVFTVICIVIGFVIVIVQCKRTEINPKMRPPQKTKYWCCRQDTARPNSKKK